jgi:hypothetical protein
MEQHIPEAMEGHEERARAHAAMRDQQRAAAVTRGVLGAAMRQRRARRGKPVRMTRDLTAAQLHKREAAALDIDLEKAVQRSGLWDGIPHSRRVWCARLRELKLHPERFEQIKARSTSGQRARLAAAEALAESNG